VSGDRVRVTLCRGCATVAHPGYPPDSWMYIDPPFPEGSGCWGCGATDVPLMPRGEDLPPGDDGVTYRLGDLTIHRYLGTGQWADAPTQGDDDDE
jgi:hypothetical protein